MHRLTVLLLPLTGRYGSHNSAAPHRLSPKKACPTGRKTNRHDHSFRCKVRRTRVAEGISRERRPAPRWVRWLPSSTRVRDAQQRVENEACLENPLGVSKARGSRGILPPNKLAKNKCIFFYCAAGSLGKGVERNPHGGRRRATERFRWLEGG